MVLVSLLASKLERIFYILSGSHPAVKRSCGARECHPQSPLEKGTAVHLPDASRELSRSFSVTEIVARPAYTTHPLWLLVVGGAVLGSALIVGSAVAFRFARRRNDPNPVLILLPEGVIEYVSEDKPIIGIPFAEVAELSITSSATTTSATSILGRLRSSSSLNSIHAQIAYRDGHQDSWQPRSTFETAATFPQAMMDAYRKTLDTE